jgi:hypothetical protein
MLQYGYVVYFKCYGVDHIVLLCQFGDVLCSLSIAIDEYETLQQFRGILVTHTSDISSCTYKNCFFLTSILGWPSH